MESVRAWLQDRKNLPIVAAGTGIIIIIVALVFLKITGKIGGGREAATTGVPGYPSPTGTPGVPPAGSPGVAPTGPGALPPGMPGAPPAVAPVAQPVAAAGVKQPPMLPYRKDPFEPFGGPPKKIYVLQHYIPNVRRWRLAPAAVVREGAGVEVKEFLPPQPVRRMAGVMWNGRIAAILETNGEADVVRPGMEISKGGSRVLVDSIQPSFIILKTLDTRTPMTIKVNLAGSIGAGQPGYPSPGGPIYPGEASGAMPPGL